MKSKSPSAALRKSTPDRCSRPLGAAVASLLLAFAVTACSAPESSSAPTDIAPAADARIQTETIAVQTPSAGWSLEASAAYRVADEHWLIFQLTPPSGMAASVISEVSATARFKGPDLPARLFVLGKTWSWNSNPSLEFIDSLDPLKESLADAQPLPLISD